MVVKSNELIDDLTSRTNEVLAEGKKFNQLSLDQLNKKTNPDSWSALECLEHLNRYGEFYLPEISKKITQSKKDSIGKFKSNWLGEYFAQSMLPKEKLNTMKTFKSMDPSGSNLDKRVIEKFIAQQITILDLLSKARNVNLVKTKTNISISKFIKLRLGDTFRVVIYHNQRHMVQANKALNF